MTFPLADVVRGCSFGSAAIPATAGRDRARQTHGHVHGAEAVPGAFAGVRIGGQSCMSRRSGVRRSCMRRTTPFGCPLSEPEVFAALFRPRASDSNKGLYGHVLVIAGGRGKTGAAAMAGIAALRAGAGLSTVASAASAITAIASYAPEIMTEPLAETEAGSIAMRAPDDPALAAITDKKNVIAIGPGMGQNPETVQFIRRFVQESTVPMVVDADALNALAGQRLRFARSSHLHSTPGRDVALDRQNDRRDSGGSHRPCARVRHRAWRLSGAEREPHRDRLSGWPCVDQSHRLAGHGDRRHGRCAHRNDRGPGGAVSRSNSRTRCSPRSTCMGARASWAPRRLAKNP